MENKATIMTNQNNGSCKGMNLDEILRHYKLMQLTEKTMKDIEAEYGEKEAIWMNEERMD